jgi:hypothetical protein
MKAMLFLLFLAFVIAAGAAATTVYLATARPAHAGPVMAAIDFELGAPTHQ